MDEIYEYLDNIDPEWKQNPAYKKFLEMDKTTKSSKEEAMKLKRDTIRTISQKHIAELANDSFKGEALKNLVKGFHPQMKAILADLYMDSRKIFNANGLSNNKERMHKFAFLIVSFVDSIDKLTERGHFRSNEIIKKFPELVGSDFATKLNIVSTSMDELARLIKEGDKIMDEQRKRQEINERLKKIFGSLENK